MAVSSSKFKTDFPEKKSVKTGKISKSLGFWGKLVALSDTLIASCDTNLSKICIVDLDIQKADESKVSECEGFIIDKAVACCVSNDRKLFMVLSNNKLHTWPLDKVRTLADFKRTTSTSCTLETSLERDSVRRFFLVGNNSHAIATYILDGYINVLAINMKNGKSNKISIDELSVNDLCALGENRIVMSQGEKGLFAYNIIFRDQDVLLSEPIRLVDLKGEFGFGYCTASDDGRFLGTIYINARGLEFHQRWSVQPDLKTVAMGNFVVGSPGNFEPFFTSNNTFIHRQHRPGVIETVATASDSTSPSLIELNYSTCALPNGDIFELDYWGEKFNIHRGPNKTLNLEEKGDKASPLQELNFLSKVKFHASAEVLAEIPQFTIF